MRGIVCHGHKLVLFKYSNTVFDTILNRLYTIGQKSWLAQPHWDRRQLSYTEYDNKRLSVPRLNLRRWSVEMAR